MNKPRVWTTEEYQKVVALKQTGWSWSEIAKEYGISKQNAIAAFRRAVGAKHGSYKDKSNSPDGEFTNFEESNDYLNIVCASKRMVTKEDLINQFGIDTNIWEIDKFKVKTSEGFRKDRKVDWHVKGGSVVQGDVTDTGKMLVVPLYHVELHLVKRKDVAKAKTAIAEMIEDAKKHSPVYDPISYITFKDDPAYLAEIDMFDVHFGRLTWDEESGGNYDIKIAKKVVFSALEKLLDLLSKYQVERIVLPIGNDWFNVDTEANTTTRGTPQREDTRWQKTFRAGRETMVQMIDRCSAIAPVDVLVIPGNHDLQRSFFLGEALTGWYNNNPNVSIDNRAAQRKYYQYGKNLLAFTHGSEEKLASLPAIMALEQPQLWAKTLYREWHTGDKHHRKDFELKTDETTGVVVRILSSLAVHDSWTFNQGYKAVRAAQAFLWDPKEGLVSQFTAVPEEFKE